MPIHTPSPRHPTRTPIGHHPSPITGLHVIAELFDCPPSPLMTDGRLLEENSLTLVRNADLADVAVKFHTFDAGAGVTGTVVLAESHVCLHTWPEHHYVSLDVFVCNYSADNSNKARQLASQLIGLFNPGNKQVRELQRGGARDA